MAARLVTAGPVLVTGPDLISTGIPRAGYLFILASTVTGAPYAILSRKLVERISPLPLALVQQAAGFCAIVAGLTTGTRLGWIDSRPADAFASPVVLAIAVLSGLLEHQLVGGALIVAAAVTSTRAPATPSHPIAKETSS